MVMNHVTARSGGEIALLRTLKALDTTRYRIVVALPDKQGMLVDELGRMPGVSVRIVRAHRRLLATRRFGAAKAFARHPAMVLGLVATVWQHVRAIRQERADIVFGHFLQGMNYRILWANRQGIARGRAEQLL